MAVSDNFPLLKVPDSHQPTFSLCKMPQILEVFSKTHPTSILDFENHKFQKFASESFRLPLSF